MLAQYKSIIFNTFFYFFTFLPFLLFLLFILFLLFLLFSLFYIFYFFYLFYFFLLFLLFLLFLFFLLFYYFFTFFFTFCFLIEKALWRQKKFFSGLYLRSIYLYSKSSKKYFLKNGRMYVCTYVRHVRCSRISPRVQLFILHLFSNSDI